jgi:hypothetical protein
MALNKHTPEQFITQIHEFRDKITREKFISRITDIKQEELVDLIKLQAEVKARYLIAILDLAGSNPATMSTGLEDVRQFRLIVDEMDISIDRLISSILSKEVPVDGLIDDHLKVDNIELALEKFIKEAMS